MRTLGFCFIRAFDGSFDCFVVGVDDFRSRVLQPILSNITACARINPFESRAESRSTQEIQNKNLLVFYFSLFVLWVVSQLVEFKPVLQQIFATQPVYKKDTFHCNQQFDHGGPQNHRMKVVTAKPSTSMEIAPPT